MEQPIEVKKSRPVITVILCFFLFISACITLFSFCIKTYVMDEEYYFNAVLTDAYVGEIHDAIDKELDYIYLSYELDDGALDHVVTDTEIRALSYQYLQNLFIRLKTGSDVVEKVPYPMEKFSAAIEGYYKSKGVEYTERAVAFLAYDCSYAARENINAIKQNTLLEPFEPLFASKLSNILREDSIFVLFCAVTLLFLLLCLLTGARSLRSRIYGISASLFCASALLFVPVFALKNFDLPSRLALEAGAFRSCFSAILSAGIQGVYTALGIAATLTTLLLIVSIILASGLAKDKNVDAIPKLDQ